jgi:23S rRNA (cytidine1920-2'-O)/16S rRNA (cytidine1409-2'-O)-methyltransferase
MRSMSGTISCMPRSGPIRAWSPLEGVNGRDLDAESMPDPIDLLVSDLSFVSVLKVLDAPLRLCAPAAEAVILIKPQFEVGRAHVGKGGVVTDAAAIARAVAAVVGHFEAAGWVTVLSTRDSPIAGGDGNREIVAAFRRILRDSRPG